MSGTNSVNTPRTVTSGVCSRERGAAAVEFALVLPLLILLVFGIIQLSIAYNQVQGLHAAAREGARLGSLPSSSDAEIRARVAEALQGVPGNPTITQVATCQGSGATVSIVEIELTKDITIPIWGTQSKTLHGRGEFKCE